MVAAQLQMPSAIWSMGTGAAADDEVGVVGAEVGTTSRRACFSCCCSSRSFLRVDASSAAVASLVDCRVTLVNIDCCCRRTTTTAAASESQSRSWRGRRMRLREER